MLNRINNLLQQEEMIRKERATATEEVLAAAKLLGINLETNNTIVKNEITINKGRIVEVEVTKEVVQEVVVDNTDYTTIEALKEEIDNLKNELEIKDALIANLTARLHNAEEETNEEEQEEISIGGDSVESLFINVPDKYLAYSIVADTLNYWTKEVENVTEKKLGGRVVLSKEKAKEMAIAKANEELTRYQYSIYTLPILEQNTLKWLMIFPIAILVVVIPVTRAIRLAVYRKKIKMEDSF